MNITGLKQIHQDTCSAAMGTMLHKNHDYTNPFSNFEMSEMLGIDPRLGLLLRVLDKIKRMETFISKGELKVTSESFDDAIEDVINYMILLKGLNIQMTESKLVTESPLPKTLFDQIRNPDSGASIAVDGDAIKQLQDAWWR